MRLWNVNIANAIVLGMAIGMVALIVTKTYIFERIRDWVQSKSNFFGRWIECPICFSTWVSFFGMFIVGKVAETQWSILDWVITWFFLDFIACLSAGILYKLYKSND